MTRPLRLSPATPELIRLHEDVEEALRSKRFDREFYDEAMRRVSTENGDFGDVMIVVNAAVTVGVLQSIDEVITRAPTHRWDPETRSIVPLPPSS